MHFEISSQTLSHLLFDSPRIMKRDAQLTEPLWLGHFRKMERDCINTFTFISAEFKLDVK